MQYPAECTKEIYRINEITEINFDYDAKVSYPPLTHGQKCCFMSCTEATDPDN